MKKKLKNVIAAIDARLKKNTLSEDAQALWEEVRAAFEALAEDEAEHNITELQDKFEELAAKYAKQNAEAEEAVAERIQKVRNEIMATINAGKPVKEKLTKEVAQAVANAIAKSRNREEVRNNVEAVLKENGITGLSYGYIVDYSLELKVEDNEGLYDQLHKTPFTRFIYSEIDRTQATQIAKQWDKTSETEKAIQELAANDRTISTKYIYKRQQFAQEDLDEIEDNGQLQEFLATISNELRVLVKSGIVEAILVGDQINPAGDQITTFETIGTKAASDAFTTVMKSNDADVAAFLTGLGASTMQSSLLAAARLMVSRIYNPYGKKIVLCMHKDTLTAMAAYIVAAGGDVTFRTREELAALIGVDEIYTSELMPVVPSSAGSAAVFVAFMPDGYWVKEKKVLDVAYPTYEKNVHNMQFEINAGGKLHDLLSSAVFNYVVE